MIEFMKEVLEYSEVQKYMERTDNNAKAIRRMKRGFWLAGWIISSYRRERKKCEKRFYDLKKNGMVMNLSGEHSGTKFYLPLLTLKDGKVGGEFNQRLIFKTEDYFDVNELRRLKEKRYVRENMNVLDIGANIGNHTLFFANECKVNHIYSFEPIAETYSILCKNVEINALKQVSLHNIALGQKKSSVSIKYFNADNYGNTSLQYGGDIECYALDELSIDEKIDFIKIDVEGFENEVLLGGVKLIKRDKPAIYVEIFEENRSTVENTLDSLGYKLIEKRYDDYLFMPIDVGKKAENNVKI